MKIIDPSFEIDNKGRVICQNHPNYVHFIDPTLDYFQDLYLDFELTCKTCSHYEHEECYFSKERIDEIEESRKSYKCKLCGLQIHRMFTIIYKKYNKERYNINIPLICCDCYEYLFKKEFMREAKNKVYVDLFTLLFLIYSLWILLFLKDIYNFMTVFIFLWLIPWSFFTYYGLRRLKRNVNGIIYYKKYFADQLDDS